MRSLDVSRVTKRMKILGALVLIVLLGFACTFANAQTLYAQSVLHEIGDWANMGELLGPPDGQYAYTTNSVEQPWAWASLSTGSAVWLDFGKVVHSGTIVVYHDDPGGHYTDLVVSPWYGFCPGVPWPVPLASDAGCIQGNIQGNGTATCYTTPFDFRYVRLNHFTLDSSLQDGIDAVAVIEGVPSGVGIDLVPPPTMEGPAVYAAGQSNNSYWNNPEAVLGAPDGVYAWSRNPQHTMPHLVVDLGSVVYSGTIVIHHDKTHLLKTSLAVSINSQEYDTDPETCPAWPYNMDEWEALWVGHAEGVTTLQFPPTSFRYIQLGQSQCYPGQEDGIDAVEVYQAIPEPPAIEAAINIDPDTLNLNSKGKWITCYIELPEDYDVEDIDISTIKLNDQVPAESHPMGIGDNDDDGIPDLMVKFDRAAVQQILEVGDEVEITVTGELNDETPFEGSDAIRVIDKGGKK